MLFHLIDFFKLPSISVLWRVATIVSEATIVIPTNDNLLSRKLQEIRPICGRVGAWETAYCSPKPQGIQGFNKSNYRSRVDIPSSWQSHLLTMWSAQLLVELATECKLAYSVIPQPRYTFSHAQYVICRPCWIHLLIYTEFHIYGDYFRKIYIHFQLFLLLIRLFRSTNLPLPQCLMHAAVYCPSRIVFSFERQFYL